MSADTTPIAPARFAAALQSLSIGMLHLKVLEIRNSIAHLQYSNDQLRPFAEGSATALSSQNGTPPPAAAVAQEASAEPDQDCVDAIRENEGVIERMMERIALVKAEVEERNVSWTEFQSKEEIEARQEARRGQAEGERGAEAGLTNGERHSAWADGTFQTGTIRNGEVRMDGQVQGQQQQGGGGRLTDEELTRALEERMRELGNDNDEDEGMHL